MLAEAAHDGFDVVIVWASDRLGGRRWFGWITWNLWCAPMWHDGSGGCSDESARTGSYSAFHPLWGIERG